MKPTGRHRRSAWRWLFVVPFAGVLFPPLYARSDPSLFGFPFFYWYLFAWIAGGALVAGLVARLEG